MVNKKLEEIAKGVEYRSVVSGEESDCLIGKFGKFKYDIYESVVKMNE